MRWKSLFDFGPFSIISSISISNLLFFVCNYFIVAADSRAICNSLSLFYQRFYPSECFFVTAKFAYNVCTSCRPGIPNTL
jgi:hypothetical protein